MENWYVFSSVVIIIILLAFVEEIAERERERFSPHFSFPFPFICFSLIIIAIILHRFVYDDKDYFYYSSITKLTHHITDNSETTTKKHQ